ncbi:outer membrane protein assembly factor BamE [Catenovulum maritimum]|nr:outer membrane protein assembly factor BamE [Catenovulum maritimum]
MKLFTRLASIILILGLASCAYRIDIRQGNYIEKKDVDKLRINMSKEQVAFVLGNPVLNDTFNKDTWHYIYTINYGDGRPDARIELILDFTDNKLAKMSGNIDEPENFNQSLDI